MFFLLRYDTERKSAEEMSGFFEQAIEVHREHRIPATFFCTGGAIETREKEFRAFAAEVKDDPLFDIQDPHSSVVSHPAASSSDREVAIPGTFLSRIED